MRLYEFFTCGGNTYCPQMLRSGKDFAQTNGGLRFSIAGRSLYRDTIGEMQQELKPFGGTTIPYRERLQGRLMSRDHAQ